MQGKVVLGLERLLYALAQVMKKEGKKLVPRRNFHPVIRGSILCSVVIFKEYLLYKYIWL